MAETLVVGELLNSPLGKTLAQFSGAAAISKLMGMIEGPSPYEQAAQQQLGIGKTLIPQLQAQAAGQPTAATQAQMGQLSQEVNRLQQSYGASATRGGMGGPVGGGGLPTASRAQQGRYQASKVQAMGGIMGQSMTSAQQQLGGFYSQGMQMQGTLEMEQRQARSQALSDIGDLYAENKLDPELQASLGRMEEWNTRFTTWFSSLLPQQQAVVPQGTNTAGWMTPTTTTPSARVTPAPEYTSFKR